MLGCKTYNYNRKSMRKATPPLRLPLPQQAWEYLPMNCISRLLLRQDWFDRFPLSRERQWGGLEITEKVVVITEVIDFSGKGDTEGFIFHNFHLTITFSRGKRLFQQSVGQRRGGRVRNPTLQKVRDSLNS
jgi:hypothetical protein